jgi:hypothetical protein
MDRNRPAAPPATVPPYQDVRGLNGVVIQGGQRTHLFNAGGQLRVITPTALPTRQAPRLP